MCQYRFIDCNKSITVVGDIDSGEAVYVWGRGMWELCTFPQLCCGPKIALNNKVHRKNVREKEISL